MTRLINRRKDCLCFYANVDCLTLVLTPLYSNYNERKFIKLNTRCQNIFNISCNFYQREYNDFDSVYDFFLTDENYGLRIDGNLFFTSI